MPTGPSVLRSTLWRFVAAGPSLVCCLLRMVGLAIVESTWKWCYSSMRRCRSEIGVVVVGFCKVATTYFHLPALCYAFHCEERL